ncbi:MAG: 23S rRNA pseudouridine(1911/1915/1917) synthase RluD [Gammaproteobacteria bacterium]|nr:23S rRNA pseudouridine(1911/1915/1917) synthase RluD [Gammaproteobacteria bacterium]
MPNEKLTLVVPDELAGRRLDQALSKLCPQHSRSRLQRWVKAGNVKVDDRIIRQRDPVKAGATIEIVPIYETQTHWLVEAIPLDIIYEDESIIVLNKPAGLVVHPGAGNPDHTLLNALLYHDQTLQQVPRAGIVQRLDKDTSGIMVVARTPAAHTFLVDQLKQRLVRREYQAIVNGVMTAGGRVAAAIGRHPVHRKRMAVMERGKPATSHYRILKKYPAHTHIQLTLESGRTHQIRVHMAYIRFPVVGDPVYGGRNLLPKNVSQAFRQIIQSFPRQALHACVLGLQHPVSADDMIWTVPLPKDMQDLLNAIESDARNK